MYELLDTVNRSHSKFHTRTHTFVALPFRAQFSSLGVPNHGNTLLPGPPQNDRLTVKRELENQDDASAREMYEVLNAVNRGQSRLPPFLISVFSLTSLLM